MPHGSADGVDDGGGSDRVCEGVNAKCGGIALRGIGPVDERHGGGDTDATDNHFTLLVLCYENSEKELTEGDSIPEEVDENPDEGNKEEPWGH